ncbi:MAG: TIR domain-containing protein, partial [Halobacteriota archaeon]
KAALMPSPRDHLRKSSRPVPDRFLVAFSFAGQQREFVRAVAESVERELGSGTVFLDEWFEFYIAGADADLKLQKIYGEKCELVVVCVSKHYGGKSWTQAEHEAVRARLMQARNSTDKRDRDRVLPIRVGEGDVQGIPINALVPDVRGNVTKAVDLILGRLQHTHKITPPPNNSTRVGPAVREIIEKRPPEPEYKPLPQPPNILLRQKEIEHVVKNLCLDNPPPTVVLGRAGIGKSVVSLTALHHEDVVQKYRNRRFFVQLGNLQAPRDTIAEEMVAEIAREMILPLRKNPLARVVSKLHESKTALVLDSIEVAWQSDPSGTEEILFNLTEVPGLALIATCRGPHRPGGARWRDRLVLEDLEMEESKKLFDHAANLPSAGYSHRDALLEKIPGVPLLVELIASALQSKESIERLFNAIERMPSESSPDTTPDIPMIEWEPWFSVIISVTRIDDDAARLLSLLGILPDGIALSTALPFLLKDKEIGDRHRALGAVCQRRFAEWQDNRIRIRTPVGPFVRATFEPNSPDLDNISTYFNELALRGNEVGRDQGGEAAKELMPDSANIETVLLKGLQGADPLPALNACIAYGRFQRFAGVGTTYLLNQAILVAKRGEYAVLIGRLYRTLGNIARMRSDHTGALGNYQRALEVYESALMKSQEQSDTVTHIALLLGKAHCFRGFGDSLRVHSDQLNAKVKYTTA